ncbi:MAG: TIGR03751 family conjugal transfer lipoprotein [Gammaproteobacteria bacterium]|nr:TIGR03751 family conjugal transfer lipoprotein [Gammaproteobacteria bacterium]
MTMLVKVGLISLSLSIASCSNSFLNKVRHSGNAKTIEQIYTQHEYSIAPVSRRVPQLSNSGTDLKGYTRDVNNELSLHFPRLPNPTIVLYVFPHLSLEGTPVPGYSTTFPMYETIEYALPWEILVQ